MPRATTSITIPRSDRSVSGPFIIYVCLVVGSNSLDFSIIRKKIMCCLIKFTRIQSNKFKISF